MRTSSKVFIMIFLTVTLCIMGSGVAQAAWSYNLTPYLWAEDYTYYRVGSTVSQKGSSWVDATRKSAGKWSNHHSNDVSKYGLSPLPVSYTHLRAHETDSYLVCRL